MNEHINPQIEIRRIDSELKQVQSAFSAFLDRYEQDDETVKRIRFDLDEFKTNIKENKSDKAVNSALKRLDNEITKTVQLIINFGNKLDKEMNNVWQSVTSLETFMNEERFKPVFDRLKELEQEYKQKALEVVQMSLSKE